MKRLSTRSGICLAAAATAAGVVALVMLLRPYGGSGITEGNYKLLAEGMTEEEVAAVLGCPPGDYTGGRAMRPGCGMPFVGRRIQEWVGFDGYIWVEFGDADGRLNDKAFRQTYLWPEQNWLDRVKGYCRDALGL